MHIAHQSVSTVLWSQYFVHTVVVTDRWRMMTVMLSMPTASFCSTVLNLFDDLQLQNVNEYVHVLKHVLIIYVVTEHRK